MENRDDDLVEIMKGENRMKKITVGLLVLMLIGMTLFVSCSNEPKSLDEGVGSVKFIGTDSASASRGLTRINPTFDANSMVWKYEAKKTDTSGLKTGETSGKTLLGTDGKISTEVGPFSQGIWEFTLYAYENMTKANADKYAYKGVASNVKITSAATNSVRVTVDAQQNGTGFIEVAKNITLQDANGNSISEHNEKIILTNLADSSTQEKTNSSTRSFEVASGAWKVNVIFYDTQNPEIIYGDNVIYVNVYDNLTTKVGGSLDEITASTKFVTESGVTTAISEKAMSASSDNTLSVESTPAAVQDTTNKTEVTIPANATSVSEGATAVLSVTPYVAKDADTRFSVQVAQEEDDVAAIAGLDITVAINDVLVERFDEAITITTYIAKGLEGTVEVKYNGEGDQPTDVTYVKDTGALSFKTTHLSEYYVIADAAAINITKNTAYATLAGAISGAAEGDTILMLKDYANTDYSQAVNYLLKKNAVLDGNGHTLEGNVSVYVNAGGGTVLNVVFKNIHNDTTITKSYKDYYKFTEKEKGNKTAVYASSLTGKLVIKNCTFDTIDWDAIQTTPQANATIEITGNTFKFDVSNEFEIREPLRYVHVESSYYTDFRALITGNYMYNCDALNQTGLELYYPSDISKIEMSNNYIDSPFSVCILTGYGTAHPELTLPFSVGKNGEPACNPVCWSKDSFGNQKLFTDLSDAFASGNGTVTLLTDIDTSSPIVVKNLSNLVLDMKGKKIYNSNDIWNDPDDDDTVNDWSLISVQNAGLTIKGNGYLEAKENDCFAIDIRDGGTVTINNGTYIGNISAIYVLKGSLTIKGGDFSIQQLTPNKPYEFMLNCLDANYESGEASIEVQGGTFHGFNPASCGAESSDMSTNFLKEGYVTSADESKTPTVYTVVSATN
ncbi:MAG: hypothetical protein ACI4NM_11915 [Bullifex sp.]